eukprot:GEZU01019913.1.p1 GENE.GEZU01019913.1~~GEZU01019913.1.p1  ORF type:complete len:136 (+),score=31.86 GEZU01019913.1:22-408(+)
MAAMEEDTITPTPAGAAAVDPAIYRQRLQLYEDLLMFFPEEMTQPKASLLDHTPIRRRTFLICIDDDAYFGSAAAAGVCGCERVQPVIFRRGHTEPNKMPLNAVHYYLSDNNLIHLSVDFHKQLSKLF